jgi:hypothetical protein
MWGIPGVEDGRRLPAQRGPARAGPPGDSGKAILGVAHLQGIEALGMVGPGETPLIPLAIWT